MSDAKPLHVRVHYDFASTLCYVAHRALARSRGPIEALGIELAWTPLELTRLVGGRRAGAEIGELQRGAAALLADARGRGASWRERAFSAVFEEGRLALGAAAAAQLARELALELWRRGRSSRRQNVGPELFDVLKNVPGSIETTSW